MIEPDAILALDDLTNHPAQADIAQHAMADRFFTIFLHLLGAYRTTSNVGMFTPEPDLPNILDERVGTRMIPDTGNKTSTVLVQR